MKPAYLPRTALFLALALVTACSSSSTDSATGGGGGGGRASGPGSGGGGGSGPPADPEFAKCGGKIYDKSGKFDAAEYARVARAWDREAIDCRLGPKFSDLHPGDADGDRPTAPALPLIDRSGQQTYLCPEFDHDTPGPAGYGSTSGQAAFAPDDASAIGLDRVQTSGWEGPGICFQPLQGGWLGGASPDGVAAAWKMQGLDVGVPIAKGRTEQGETGDGVIIFSSGLVGTDGTVSSGSSHPTLMLPKNKVPTAVSVTNYNEFALVTVWDTDANKGQVAVIALRANAPGAFSIHLYGAPNEGGFDGMKLLGYVDLPEGFRTPTAISVSGNNTQRDGHPWVDDSNDPMAYQGIGSLFGNLDYDAMTQNPKLYIWQSDPKMGEGLFGSAGGAVIASAWEDKVAFLDLAPLFAFVRKVYVEPVVNKDNEDLYKKASDPATAWPFDFASNPEMKPKVVATQPITHPNVVRLGLRPDAYAMGIAGGLLGWVGTLDGTLAFFDASVLQGKGSTSPIKQIAKIKADPNPTSLHLLDHNHTAFLSSRGNRSVQWVSVSDTAPSVDQTFRDSRVDDPVWIDHNQRWGNLLTIADFSGKKIFNFESSCDDMGKCTWSFDGDLKLPGNVYFIDTANVN